VFHNAALLLALYEHVLEDGVEAGVAETTIFAEIGQRLLVHFVQMLGQLSLLERKAKK
jgi:hypothetical protein